MELSSQRKRYRYSTQGYPGGCHSFKECQRGNIRPESFPASTYQVSPYTETALWDPLSLSSNKRKASTTAPETRFDTRFMGHDGNSNGFLDFPAGSNPMLQPTKLSATRDDQQQKGNDALSYTPMQVPMGSSPSILGLQTHWAPEKCVQSEFPGIPSFCDIAGWKEGFPVPVNDPWSLNLAGTQLDPLNNVVSQTGRFHSFDWGMGISDVPQWVQEPPVTLAKSMPDYSWDISPDSSLPSYDICWPFKIGELMASSLQEMEDTAFHSYPGNQALDLTFNFSNSLVDTISDSNPDDSNRNTSSSIIEPTKALVPRSILPMPPPRPSDAVSDTNNNDGTQQSCTQSAQRRRFTAKEKEEIFQMRQIGACGKCIAKKIKCTKGRVCVPCRGKNSKYTLQQLPTCHRGQLDQYKEDFFSPFFAAHLEQGTVQSMTSNIQFFSDRKRAYVSLGASYPSMPLEICKYHTAIGDLSRVPDLASKTNDHLMTFTSIATLPYGVPSDAIGHLRQTCLCYVEDISSCMNISMGFSRITRETFNATRNFERASRLANQDNLLRNAIKISTIYHILARRFFFTEDSLLEMVGIPQYQSTDLPSQCSNSSSMVNQQIKAELHGLLKDLVPKALLELDGRLRLQKKDMWASCLCVLLLLCPCIEEIQVVVDGFILIKSSEGGDPALIRESGLNISRGLEERALKHMQILLDGLLKSFKRKRHPSKTGPQVEGEAVSNEVGMSEAEMALINELRQVIDENKEELIERQEDNYCGGHSQNIGDNKAFRVRNRARLQSKMLWRLQSKVLSKLF